MHCNERKEVCGCGQNNNQQHQHDHQHGEEGCCGGGCCGQEELVLSQEQFDFLMIMTQTPYLPVTRFVMKSTKSEHLVNAALEPAYMESGLETLEQVKASGGMLTDLEAMGLITLDYDLPLSNGDYETYKKSALYAYFVETVAEGSRLEGALFDIPELELGSIALTEIGQSVVEQLSEMEEGVI